MARCSRQRNPGDNPWSQASWKAGRFLQQVPLAVLGGEFILWPPELFLYPCATNTHKHDVFAWRPSLPWRQPCGWVLRRRPSSATYTAGVTVTNTAFQPMATAAPQSPRPPARQHLHCHDISRTQHRHRPLRSNTCHPSRAEVPLPTPEKSTFSKFFQE